MGYRRGRHSMLKLNVPSGQSKRLTSRRSAAAVHNNCGLRAQRASRFLSRRQQQRQVRCQGVRSMPETPYWVTVAPQLGSPQLHERVFHAVPVCATARTPLSVCWTTKRKVVAGAGTADGLAMPSALIAASQMRSQARVTRVHWQPALHTAAHPVGVASIVKLNELIVGCCGRGVTGAPKVTTARPTRAMRIMGEVAPVF